MKVYACTHYEPIVQEGGDHAMIGGRADNAARTYWWIKVPLADVPLSEAKTRDVVAASAEGVLGHTVAKSDIVVLP